jgi:tetratricopeptide (TPR) repeat protein
MRILGPDGRPIETGPPVSEEVRKIVEQAKANALQAEQAQAQGNDPAAHQFLATALQHLAFAFQSDVTSDLVLDTTCDLLRTMMQAQGHTESEELQLFEAYRQERTNPIIAYQLGNRFAQLGQTFLARPFLLRARQLLNDPQASASASLSEDQKPQLGQAIDTDLAQVYMDRGDYQQAVETFHQINDTYGGLHIGLVLMMAECYALLRQLDEAEAAYAIARPEVAAQLEGMEAWREEVGDLIARVHDFDDQEDLGLRAWHYVQTRGMLLETKPEDSGDNIPGERWIAFQPSEEDVAYIVALTAALLDQKGYAPSRLFWLGESSEPLARLFGQWWEIPEENIRPYEQGDNAEEEAELGLLVMAHSYDVFSFTEEEAFLDLLEARAGLITFALDLHWTDRQPMTPDIAGFMTQICQLPWETRFEVSADQQTIRPVQETRDARTVAADIARQFPEEAECDQWAKEALEEYAVCTDLILDHRDGTLLRRPLPTHSPAASPRLGF